MGSSQRIIDKKIKPTKWTQDKLNLFYSNLEDKQLGDNLIKILDWTVENNLFKPTTTKTPTFGLNGKASLRIFIFLKDGSVYLYTNLGNYPDKQERDNLVHELKFIELLDNEFNPNDVISGRNLSKTIQTMNEKQITSLLDILEKYCQET